MKIVPIYQNAATQVFGAFMEGVLPDVLNYDLPTLLNNMVTGRLFSQAPNAAGQQYAAPTSVTSLQTSPQPAWTTVQGFRGKRVMPKVSFPTFAQNYQDAVSYSAQLDMIFATIMFHRFSSTSSATPPGLGSSALPGPRVQNADGTWTLVEYDFGADVAVTGLASMTTVANVLNILNASVPIFLQVLSGSTWTDVCPLAPNLTNGGTYSEKFYQLPATVTGRKFRVVVKSSTQPMTSGIATFAMHFYGDYVGAVPRTFGKIQHLVMFPLAFGPTGTTTPAFSNMAPINYGRQLPHYGFSVTDDLKLASTNDILISDATVYPGQEQAVGALQLNFKPAPTEVF